MRDDGTRDPCAYVPSTGDCYSETRMHKYHNMVRPFPSFLTLFATDNGAAAAK